MISKRKIVHAVLAGLLMMTAGITRANPIEQTFQFDCDVPAGNVSDWVGTFLPDLQRISGRIELIEPRTHKHWFPAASVFLVEGENKFGLQLYLDRKNQDVLQVAVLRPVDKGGRTVIATVPWKRNPIDFSLSLLETGDVEVEVAHATVPLKVARFKADRIALSCSTAQFKFIDVTVRSDFTP